MQLKEVLVNTALLGTDKKPISAEEMPELLRPEIEKILNDKGDNDLKFLKTSAVALNYYRSGLQPVKMDLPVDIAEEEVLPYCNEDAFRLLKDLLEEKYYTLVWLWTKLCTDKKQIVQPQLLQQYFEWGITIKSEAPAFFARAIGNRGVWLSKFSSDWNFVRPVKVQEPEEFEWDTAVIADRVNFLEGLRPANPVLALEKIKSVWQEENAANRTDMISTLAINISKTDEKFLVACLNEKSIKVKDKALELLKLIPDSAIMESYKKVIRDSIQMSKGKMLGLIGKGDVKVKLVVIDDSIYKTGIQNLSDSKKISDDNYVLMQLVAEIPLAFWSEQYQMTPAEVIKAFAEKQDLKKFQPYLNKAALKFKDPAWTKEILDNLDAPPVELLKVLNEADRVKYAEKFLKEYTDEVVDALRTSDLKEWDRGFVNQLLLISSDNPLRYNKSYFETIIVYFPAAIVNDLDKAMPTDEWKKNYWPGIADEIKKLISLKEQIKKAFI